MTAGDSGTRPRQGEDFLTEDALVSGFMTDNAVRIAGVERVVVRAVRCGAEIGLETPLAHCKLALNSVFWHLVLQVRLLMRAEFELCGIRAVVLRRRRWR